MTLVQTLEVVLWQVDQQPQSQLAVPHRFPDQELLLIRAIDSEPWLADELREQGTLEATWTY